MIRFGLFYLDPVPGSILDPENLPQMEPTSNPRGFEIGFENASNFGVDFKLNLAPTWLQLGPREGANEGPTNQGFRILEPSWAHLGPQGPPGTQNYGFSIDLGSIFDRFGIDF